MEIRQKWVLEFGPKDLTDESYYMPRGYSIDIINFKGTQEEFNNPPERFRNSIFQCLNKDHVIIFQNK